MTQTRTNDGWNLEMLDCNTIVGTFFGGQKLYLNITDEQFQHLTLEKMKQLWSERYLGVKDADMVELIRTSKGNQLRWKNMIYPCSESVKTIHEAMIIISHNGIFMSC